MPITDDDLIPRRNDKFAVFVKYFRSNQSSKFRPIGRARIMSSKEHFTINLGEITKNDTKVVGGKAANLGELVNRFNIPKGYVITTPAYRQFVENNHLDDFIKKSLGTIDYGNYASVEKHAEGIREYVLKCKLPPHVASEVRNKYSHLGFRDVAIRSSATAEDLPSASFAGQYESFLNVSSAEQLLNSVLKCYASLWSARALSYRHENGIPQSKVELAVIVQEMVPAKSAGVLFTRNPVSPEKDQLLIESNFGLGESIMSGRSTPDEFVVRRSGRSTLEKFSILDKRIGKKRLAVKEKKSRSEGGIEYVELSEEENAASSLTNHQIIELSQVGTRIESHFGSPQDIEWAIDRNNKLHVLQARPITSLRKSAPEDDVLWSRGYADDYWNDPVTPLYFELLGDPLTNVVNVELNSIMGYKRMDDQLLKLYNAHVYFNLKVLRRKVENEIPGMVRNEDVLNYFPEGYGYYGKRTVKKLPFHIFGYLVANLRVMFDDPNGSMGKTAKAYEKWTREVFSPYCEEYDKKLEKLARAGDAKGLQKLADEIDYQMVAHYRLVRYGIPVHNIGMNLIAQWILKRFLGEQASREYYPILISGLEHKLTETNDHIYHLASIIHESPELRRTILEEKSENLYSTLSKSNNPATRSFFAEFKEFLKEYGDRGFTREAYYPRWREAPQYVFDILKSLVKDTRIDLAESKQQGAQTRERTEKIVESRLRRQHLGFLKWFIFTKILGAARTYIIFRENQRFNLDRWITRIRSAYLEIGGILAKKGVLGSKEDIFFLQKKEIKNLVLDKYHSDDIRKLTALIKERREDFEKHENTIPPKFLHGGAEFNDTLRFTKDSTEFQGIPASQGVVTAPVRVINTIEAMSAVKKGEILVVPRTDPGWSPVFSKIGGLITETGGILSHGAVISREYGIPAVTNVPNACKMLRTGQIITINGSSGFIIVKD
jgi:phosphohistidine swiveling domain-containing protein